MMINNKESGIKAENFFLSRLNKKGVPYEYIDDWYDVLVGKIKVEVKSCKYVVKDGNNVGYRIGRFDFTSEDNRLKQRKHNVWCCFIIRSFDEYMMLGFCKANDLPNRRYHSLIDIRKVGLIRFDDWLKVVLR